MEFNKHCREIEIYSAIVQSFEQFMTDVTEAKENAMRKYGIRAVDFEFSAGCEHGEDMIYLSVLVQETDKEFEARRKGILELRESKVRTEIERAKELLKKHGIL